MPDTNFEQRINRLMGWAFLMTGLATGIIIGSAETVVAAVLAGVGGRLTRFGTGKE